jgi:hypothetical protein
MALLGRGAHMFEVLSTGKYRKELIKSNQWAWLRVDRVVNKQRHQQ